VPSVGQKGQGTGEDPSGGLNGHETDVQPSADGESHAEIGGGVTVPMPKPVIEIGAMMRVPMVLFVTLCGLVSPVVMTGVVLTRVIVISAVMVLVVRISHHS